MKNMTAIFKLALVLLVLGHTFPAWAAEIGRVSALTGRADVSRSGGVAEDLRVDDVVMQTDVIRTKSGSRLVLTMSDGSRLTMAEKTRLELKHYQIEGEPAGLLKVTRGRLRALVSKVFSNRSESFQVRTPTAVAGVMGTDFAVIVEGLFTRVVVFKGLVVVRNIDPNIPKRLILRKNQSSMIWQGEPPLPPVSLEMLIEEVLGISGGGDEEGGDGTASEDLEGERLPDNGSDMKLIPPDYPVFPGDQPVPPDPTDDPPTPPNGPNRPDPPPPVTPNGPNPPPPAPPTDPPPPGKPDGSPGPPSSPPGQTNEME